MAEALVFRTEWVIQMNDMLDHHGESRLPNEDAILRVAAPLLKMKPEAYIPQFVSMGPYHHSILEKDIDSSCAEHKISTAETCKGKAAASLFSSGRGKSFNSIVESMKQIRPEIDRFYHWPTGSSTTEDQDSSTTEDQEHSKNFALMMAVDSAFLLHFLISLYKSSHEASSSLELGPLRECIKSDILKLENQIPLFLMEKVFEKTCLELSPFQFDGKNPIYDGLPEDFNQLLQKTCLELSPFQFDGLPEDFDQQPHLLAYMHAFVSPTLQIQVMENPNLWQRLMFLILDIPLYLFSIFVIPRSFFFERKYEIALDAEKLAKAGIKFKLLSRATEKIRFDRWSGTLYLPRINICEMQTEVLLRNMVALEFNDVAARGTTVMRYIGLMDSLIQTPDDVRVLRDHHVIATDTVTDESIAKMWNNLAQPFFTGQFNLAQPFFIGQVKLAQPFFTGQVKLALDSDDLGGKLAIVLWQQKLKSKLKRMLGELYDYVSNWKFIGFVAAFLGLFLTAVQAYYTVLSYYTVCPRNCKK